jgi:dTDP-4-dehydrorhamnose reductase
MKSVLIIGANGLIGQHMARALAPTHKIYTCGSESTFADPKIIIEDYRKLDITRRKEIKRFFTGFNPAIIINAASLRNINLCEIEKTLCWDVNVRGVENIVEASQEFKPLFIQISSVHVFNGQSGMYKENDKPEPVNYFGKSALSAEKMIQKSGLEYLIARTVSVYGNGINIGQNFVSRTREKLSQNKTVEAITDHTINPTVADELAFVIFQLIEKEEYGIFHIAGSQSCSYYDFALEIARTFKLDAQKIRPVSSSEVNQAVQWTKNATFCLDKLYNTINWLPSGVAKGLKKVKNQSD